MDMVIACRLIVTRVLLLLLSINASLGSGAWSLVSERGYEGVIRWCEMECLERRITIS